jgi:hypothetical protein
MGQTNHELETRNKALIEAKFEAWASGTGSPYELLADDATWTITGKSLAHARIEWSDDLAHEGFPAAIGLRGVEEDDDCVAL